jgi:predicted Zn-dependent peptidase
VSLDVILRAGSAADPKGKEGLAALTAAMLDEGAGARSALEIADEIDYLGAELRIEAEREYSAISLDTLRRNLAPALDILADVVLRPRFEEAEWQRVKGLWLGDLAQRREEPVQVARVVGDRAFYGEDHPYGHPTTGYTSSVEGIDLQQVKDFYRRHVRPDIAAVICAGDVSAAELKSELEKRLGSWKAEGPAPALPEARPAAPPAGGPRLVVVDKPRAPQTVIRIQLPAPDPFAPARPSLQLANLIFGGTFTSRLQMNLREKHKFTYGAQSALSPRLGASYAAAQSSVHAQKTVPALVEFQREFRRIATGELAPEEVEKAHASLRTDIIETLEDLDGTIAFYLASAVGGKKPDERLDFYLRAKAAGSEAIAAACRATYAWDRALVVLVGDRALIEKQLEEQAAAARGKAAGEAFSFPGPEVRDRDGKAGT